MFVICSVVSPVSGSDVSAGVVVGDAAIMVGASGGSVDEVGFEGVVGVDVEVFWVIGAVVVVVVVVVEVDVEVVRA